MNGYSIIQIILYIVAGILAAIGILNKAKDEKKSHQYDKIYIIGIIVTLGFSILLEALKASDEHVASEKRGKEHQEYIDSLTRIISKSDVLLSKSEKTLQTQDSIQKRTDSLLNTTNQISAETQNVLLNTVDVLKFQENTIANIERERNPLFPMDLEITPRLSFNHEIFKGVVDTFLHYKKIAEANIPYDKQRIEVNWLGNKEKISNIIFKDFEKFFTHAVDNHNRIQFILNKNFHIQLYRTFYGNPEQLLKSTPIFNAITDRQFGAVHDISHLEVDYDNKIVYIILRFKKIIFINPLPKVPIGISDLFNQYLVVFPSGLCNCELISVRMEIGKTAYESLVYLGINNSNAYPWGKSGNCKIFVRKIGQNEIMRPVQPSD